MNEQTPGAMPARFPEFFSGDPLSEEELRSLELEFGPGRVVWVCDINHPCEAAHAALAFIPALIQEVRRLRST